MNILKKIIHKIKKIKKEIIKFLHEDYVEINFNEEELSKEDCYEIGIDEGKYLAYDKIKKMIQRDLKETENDDWIPIIEKPPKEDIYQVTIRMKLANNITYVAYYDGEYWYSLENNTIIDNVIAWMNLHKPYVE